jgi:hypothetical protein
MKTTTTYSAHLYSPHPASTANKNPGQPARPGVFRRWLPALWLACACAGLVTPASGTVKTWDGSSSGYWGTAANWAGNVAPVDGDDVVFQSGAANLANTNNFTSLHLNSITFTGSGYTLRGNAIAVANGVSGQQASPGANTIEFPITLGGGGRRLLTASTRGRARPSPAISPLADSRSRSPAAGM